MKHYRTTLKNSLLATALGTCTSLPVTTAAAAEDFDTPNRSASISTAQTLKQTPGQKLSMKISESLTMEKFSQVLSDDEMSSIDINWEALSNPQLPFDHPDIRSSLIRLKRVLNRLLPSKATNREFMEVWTQFSVIDASISSVHWDRVKELTPQFFQSISCEVIDLAPKYDGVQFGAKAIVKLSNGQTVKYHIKTHSGGLTSGKSSAAKLVNPAELFVYKFLEGLDIGPKSHFFGRDGQNLYIATLDVGTQIDADGSLTKTTFKEYKYFMTAQDPNVQKQLWGELTQLPLDIDFSEGQHQQAEKWINSDRQSSMFVHEMSKMDVLARLMGLTDFQTNPGNYGFIQEKDRPLMVKVLDFRLVDQAIDKFQHDDKDFTAFLRGNGLYHYISADKVMCYALRHRQQHLRVREAESIIDNELANFEKTVTLATLDVLHSLDSVMMTDTERERTKVDLEQYSDIIKYNFRLFRDQLKSTLNS